MPCKILITDADRAWLRENHASLAYTAMAERIGCCVDTLKRILVREGLQDFPGAKYQVSRSLPVKKWRRPCMRCGCKKPRPKFQYFCNACHKTMDSE